jgi:Putative phage tail protein
MGKFLAVAASVALVLATGGVGLALALPSVTLTGILTSAALTGAVGIAGVLTAPKATSIAVASASAVPSAAPANAARDVVTRQSLPPRRYVYGFARVGGALFFQDNVNPFLCSGVALSDGEIDALVGLYLGDTQIPLDVSNVVQTGTAYSGKLTVEFAPGTDAQTASALLTAAFPALLTADFRQRGVARVCTKADWGADAENNSFLWGAGVEFAYQIRGVKVTDHRTAVVAYSSNPPLCVAHAITNCWHSKLAIGDLDTASFAAAANDCDVTVTFGGVSRKLFELACVFQSDVNIAAQVTDMLQTFGGGLAFDDGKYTCIVDKSKMSVWTITDDDIFEVGRIVHGPERLFNTIKATYFDADALGRPGTTPVYSVPGAIASEGEVATSVALPCVATSVSAQILAYRALINGREFRMLTLTVSDAGLWLLPFDRVTVNSAAAPYLTGEWKVLQRDAVEIGVLLVLTNYSENAFADPLTYLQVA